jgi:tRNA G10  N-methylase Trm11
MQYLVIGEDEKEHFSNKDLIKTVERCSLIRSVYEIIAEGETFEDLAANALASGHLRDMMANGTNADASWRVSLRQYGAYAKTEKQKQYGKKMRSPLESERKAIMSMGDMFAEFTGPVDLKNADVNLFLFEGLAGRGKILARVLAVGAKVSMIAPKTRICVTNTPLCPLAAFTMNNVARIQKGYRIFDPFAGSCTILLAASMIEPTVLSVGCEIAHNGQVNRDNIVEDFVSRNLTKPSAIIRGDSMLKDVRCQAKAAVGNVPFDAIITDPPYGIREKTGFCLDPPLVNLVACIANDRAGGDGKRLLRLGGRLVAFVPNQDGDDISADMPTEEQLHQAGLEFVQMHEQPLNDSLSRWLVEYKCIQ